MGGVQEVSKLSILRQTQHDNLLLGNMSHCACQIVFELRLPFWTPLFLLILV